MSRWGRPGEPLPVEGRFAWDGGRRRGSSRRRSRPSIPASGPPPGTTSPASPSSWADPGIVYELLPDAELDGEMYDMVRVGYEAGIGDASDTYVLYVDKETSRVEAIRYRPVTYGGRPARGRDPDVLPGLRYGGRLQPSPPTWWGTPSWKGYRGRPRNEAWVTDISFTPALRHHTVGDAGGRSGPALPPGIGSTGPTPLGLTPPREPVAGGAGPGPAWPGSSPSGSAGCGHRGPPPP